MSKALKTNAKNVRGPLIKYQRLAPGAVSIESAARPGSRLSRMALDLPGAKLPAPIAAPSTPPGGASREVSLPPAPTPCTIFGLPEDWI